MGRSARSGKSDKSSTERLLSIPSLHTSRTTFHHQPSLPTPSHVVDEGAIDIGAAATDGVEERVRVCDKILFVRELVGNDLRIADVAEHHQAARHPNSFSSSACRHKTYTDPF